MKYPLPSLLLPALAVGALLILLPSCESDTSANCGKIEFKKENTVTIRMEAAATSLNSLSPSPGYNRFAAVNIFQSLAGIEAKTLELVPILIKKIPKVYTATEGPHKGALAYDFEIYDEAVWDNGSPVTANDVLFTLKIIYHPELPLGNWLGYFEYLKAFEIDPANPKKFTAYFSQFYILALETMCQTPIYPAYNYDPDGVLSNIPFAEWQNRERAQELVQANPALSEWAVAFQSPKFANDKNFISGSGAYRLENLDVDQGLTFVKKQNWWGDKLVAQNPYLLAAPDKLVFRFVKDEVPVENLIRSGELDIVPAMSPAKFLELQQDTCLGLRYNFELIGANSYGRLMLNHRNPRLADKQVRQALAHTIDYDYLINTICQGLAQRCVSPASPAKPYYARDLKPYPYDVPKARAMLEAAGWKDSNGDGIADKMLNGVRTELRLSLLAASSPISTQFAKSFQTTARTAGIAIDIVDADIRVISSRTTQGDYDLALNAAVLFTGLWDLYQTFHTKSIGADNRYGFSHPEMDRLIESIRTEPNESKRNAQYIQAQYLLHEQLPEIFLYAIQQRMIVNKRFKYVLTPNRPGYYEQYFRLIK